jgi:diketogulonate reductase-like aldo/keto reductase
MATLNVRGNDLTVDLSLLEKIGAISGGVSVPLSSVATKVHGRMGPGPNQVGLSRAHILSSIDQSLSRLQLDHVDLLQIHGLDATTPLEETVDALDTVVRSGKVR